jgi:hypothetical protein
VLLTVARKMGVRVDRPHLPLSVECADLIRCHENPFLSFGVYYDVFVGGKEGNGGCTAECSRGKDGRSGCMVTRF